MPQPYLIPRAVLFGNPDHMSPSVSPDGTLLGWVAPEDGVLNLWVAPRDGSAPARAVTHDRGRGVRDYAFCHDDRHLIYAQDNDGDENWRLYLLDLSEALLDDADPKARLVTPGDGIQARILGHNRWNPTTVLIALNDRVPQLHDVHRLDLVTGDLTRIAENQGFLDWLVDTDLAVRGGTTMAPDGSATVHVGRDGDFRPYLEIPPDDAASTGVLGFTRDGAMLVLSSIGVNATRLERHDLATGTRVVVAADDAYDISGVWQNPETLEVQAVEVIRERQEIQLLDAALAPHLDAVRALGDGDVSIGRRERSGRWWTVTVAPSDGPIHFWLYDAQTGQSRHLFPHRRSLADLPEGTLAPMEPFTFTARDGLEIHGYLTFPPGVAREGLPAVLNVHGGPWARDLWGFHTEAQWLANRGYVCVQVNFRSSTGYGKAFLNAGDKQWGLAMQDDLTDAVAHVVAQGWVDPARVGIYGGSYGGYAVLAGAVFTPDLYRCGVDIVGPSNLLTLLASVPEYWRPMIAMMHQRVGHPDTEAELLRQASPLTHVDRIRIPLLVVQGANDPRVKQAEAEQIVAALTGKGLPHSYLLFEDEGHGLAKPENRERMYAAAEAFLAEHLGGRVQE
ncbi:MAG: S9 family peptidase [Kineosporiaceae bacterium]